MHSRAECTGFPPAMLAPWRVLNMPWRLASQRRLHTPHIGAPLSAPKSGTTWPPTPHAESWATSVAQPAHRSQQPWLRAPPWGTQRYHKHQRVALAGACRDPCMPSFHAHLAFDMCTQPNVHTAECARICLHHGPPSDIAWRNLLWIVGTAVGGCCLPAAR